MTPEAVLLDFETAGVGTRLLARLLDTVIQIAMLFVLLFIFGILAIIGETVAFVMGAITLFLLFFGYPAIQETLWGRTLGKRALRLRVVTVEGAPIRFGQAAIRSMLQVPDLFVPPGGAVAVISVLFTRRGQRLGDLAADTMVIREQKVSRRSSAIWFPVPPGFEAYAYQLDVSMVTPSQYRTIRGFLSRVTDFRPEVRQSLAEQLAGPVSAAIGHQIPYGVHPESFLVCVANRYQHRHTPAPAPFAVPPTMGG